MTKQYVVFLSVVHTDNNSTTLGPHVRHVGLLVKDTGGNSLIFTSSDRFGRVWVMSYDFSNTTWFTYKISPDVETKTITPIGSYFTKRDQFLARRSGNVVTCASYISITTAVPTNTPFANLNFPAHGVLAMVSLGDKTAHPCYVGNGQLTPDYQLPVGYYSLIGACTVP